MGSFKQIIATVGVILLCAVLSIVTVGLMEGSASVLCEQCNGHGVHGHKTEKGIEMNPCPFCDGDGHAYGMYNVKLYQLIFFLVYVLSIGIVTGRLKRFTLKVGPFFFKQGGTSIIRKKKDE